MTSAVGGLVTIITGAFTNFLTGIGSSVADFFQNIFLVNTGTTSSPVWELSTLAIVSFTVLGVSLAIGLSSLVIHMVRNRRVG